MTLTGNPCKIAENPLGKGNGLQRATARKRSHDHARRAQRREGRAPTIEWRHAGENDETEFYVVESSMDHRRLMDAYETGER